MSGSTPPTPEEITLDEFTHALQQYERVIEEVSASKAAKSGQKTLAELDHYRYVEAPRRFSIAQQGAAEPMGLDDVKTLVEWKLKHGKFRPTLMKLVTSNDATAAKKTIAEALDRYKATGTTAPAIDVLTKLRGIGPATASLLLAVHDPEKVVFFADEAFEWLCGGGSGGKIKYDAKEYRELDRRAGEVVRRLGVRAVDVERLAYVLMRDGGRGEGAGEVMGGGAPRTKAKAKAKVVATAAPGKRLAAVDDEPGETRALRRSKRGKVA